jgi:Na+-driven multidrug efflux pump
LASVYYRTFFQVSLVIIAVVNALVYHFRSEIISVLTSIPEIKRETLSVIALFLFHIPPDLMKGMLQGTIKAIGIQYKCKYVNLLGHWCLYPTLVYFLAFNYQLGLRGILIAKIFLEFFLVSGCFFIIHFSNWERIAIEAK